MPNDFDKIKLVFRIPEGTLYYSKSFKQIIVDTLEAFREKLITVAKTQYGKDSSIVTFFGTLKPHIEQIKKRYDKLKTDEKSISCNDANKYIDKLFNIRSGAISDVFEHVASIIKILYNQSPQESEKLDSRLFETLSAGTYEEQLKTWKESAMNLKQSINKMINSKTLPFPAYSSDFWKYANLPLWSTKWQTAFSNLFQSLLKNNENIKDSNI